MENPLPYLVAGLVNGSVYGLASVGVVFAYRLSGTLNFAFGAIGLFFAFLYWQLNVDWGVPALLALPLCLVVAPPAVAVVTERVVLRRLGDASVFARTAAAAGLLLAFFGATEYLWALEGVTVPSLFSQRLISLPGVTVSVQQIGVVVVSTGATAAALLFLRWSRTGLEIRAAVDRRDLAGGVGLNVRRVVVLAWAVSFVFAALCGLLFAPLYGSDRISVAISLVVFSLIAAVLARLSSLPIAFAGGLAVGVVDALAVAYLPDVGNAVVRGVLPLGLLVAGLVLETRRQSGTVVGAAEGQAFLADLGDDGRGGPPVTVRSAGLALVALIGVAVVFGEFWTVVVAGGIGYAMIFLSYSTFTATTGMVSLAQSTFAGIGAFTTAIFVTEVGVPWPLAALLGATAAAFGGALVALPTVRLRGIYMVLATMAAAMIAQGTLFGSLWFIDDVSGRRLPRPAGLRDPLAYAIVLLGLFLTLGALAHWLRGTRLGRSLQAHVMSPAGAESIGVRPEVARLVIFVVASAIAGLGGAMFAAVAGFVPVLTWNLLNGLQWLALLAVGGIGSIWGALLAGVFFALIPEIVSLVPGFDRAYPPLLGLAVLLVIRRPGGIAGALQSARAAVAGSVRDGGTAPVERPATRLRDEWRARPATPLRRRPRRSEPRRDGEASTDHGRPSGVPSLARSGGADLGTE